MFQNYFLIVVYSYFESLRRDPPTFEMGTAVIKIKILSVHDKDVSQKVQKLF